jgi:hypothetical protein
MIDAVERGFSQLPPGCHIQLQQCTKDQILRSLRVALNQSWRRLRAELQSYVSLRGRASVRLADFLREQAVQLEEIYRGHGRSGWTALKRDAGLPCAAPTPEDAYFSRRFSDLLHTDDPLQSELMLRLSEPNVSYHTLPERERRRLQVLAYQVDGQHHQTGTGEQFLSRLAQAPDLRSEFGELAAVLQARGNLRFRPIPGLESVPLCLHASYGIREILTAVGWLTAEKRTPFQAGVLALHDSKVELLFVTLDKSQGFHHAIAYHDYAISADRFHWQSQNSAGPETDAGKRYLNSPANGWSFQLFVRLNQGKPYRACGPVILEKAHGEKPMSIEWRLAVPLPARLFQDFSVLRGQ